MSCLFLVTYREFNHPIHQTTQNKSQYQRENTLFSIGRESYLGATYIPQMHDPYQLDIIVKVNKQASQRYKIQCQLVS